LKVLCVGADAVDRDQLGESLDWSAPALLRQIGLPMDDPLELQVATYKRHAILKILGSGVQHYRFQYLSLQLSVDVHLSLKV
jgi:hypothetical protein